MQYGRRVGLMVLFVGVLAACARPARAVIEIKESVKWYYDISDPVVIGTVTKVMAPQNALIIKTTETVKGKAFPDVFRIQVLEVPDLVKSMAIGHPVVFFGDPVKPAIHVGDTWLIAELRPGLTPPLWSAKRLEKNDRAFPGRTDALVRVLADIKASKYSLVDKVDQRLHGGVSELAKLQVTKPTFMITADVNGDKKPDFLVGTAAGVKLFIATDKGYDDATTAWALAGINGAKAAFGDVNNDGKPDLLMGRTLYMNDGKQFVAVKSGLDVPEGATIVAEALYDVNGDTKPDACVLLGDGQLLTFTNVGLPDQPWGKGPARKLGTAAPLAAVFGDWGDNAKPHVMVISESAVTRYPIDAEAGAPAEFTRLTGELLTSQKGFDTATKQASAFSMLLKGDARRDIVIVSDKQAMVLVNRGVGVFLSDADAARPLSGEQDKALPFAPSPGLAWCAADLKGDGTDDVIVLTEEGKLYVVDNPPAAK